MPSYLRMPEIISFCRETRLTSPTPAFSASPLSRRSASMNSLIRACGLTAGFGNSSPMILAAVPSRFDWDGEGVLPSCLQEPVKTTPKHKRCQKFLTTKFLPLIMVAPWRGMHPFHLWPLGDIEWSSTNRLTEIKKARITPNHQHPFPPLFQAVTRMTGCFFRLFFRQRPFLRKTSSKGTRSKLRSLTLSSVIFTKCFLLRITSWIYDHINCTSDSDDKS